jgi:predicted nucleic-acid-binding Zn-ribbon protein
MNEFEISLEDVEVSFNNSIKNEIQISKDVFIKLRYPNVNSAKYLEMYNKTKEVNYLVTAIIQDIESVMDSDNSPKLTKEINFICKKCKYSEIIVLSGLSDFFV